MGWLIIPLLILVIIFGAAFCRTAHHGYRFGSGLFKSSEDNFDEKEELPDKDYYDKDGLMK